MVLSLLSMLLAFSGLLIGLSLLTKNRFRKTTIMISTISVLLLITTISIFFYTMSQLTEIGVGSFMGKGELETTLPGVASSEMIMSNWGPSIGFYLTLITLIIIIIIPIKFSKATFFIFSPTSTRTGIISSNFFFCHIFF